MIYWDQIPVGINSPTYVHLITTPFPWFAYFMDSFPIAQIAAQIFEAIASGMKAQSDEAILHPDTNWTF